MDATLDSPLTLDENSGTSESLLAVDRERCTPPLPPLLAVDRERCTPPLPPLLAVDRERCTPPLPPLLAVDRERCTPPLPPLDTGEFKATCALLLGLICWGVVTEGYSTGGGAGLIPAGLPKDWDCLFIPTGEGGVPEVGEWPVGNYMSMINITELIFKFINCN